MTEQPRGQEEGTLRELRVYYDARTGELLHVHRYVADAGTEDELVADRMDAFAQALGEHRPEEVQYLVVDEADLLGVSGQDVTISVDIQAKALTSRPAG
jgi:hypothetical protein